MSLESNKASAPAPAAPRDTGGYFSNVFSSLRYRAYLWLWLALSGYSISESIEWMGRNWLLWQMTGSPLLLGLMNLARSVPRLIFGLVGGVMADRVDKRQLLLYCQVTMVVLKLAMALLIWAGRVEVWHVFALAVLTGLTMSVIAPTRESITPYLVPREELVGAVSLNRVAQFLLFLLTPVAAGPASLVIGIGGIYFVAAVVNAVVVYFSWKLPRLPPEKSRAATSWWGDLTGGLHYVASHGTMLRLMILSLVPMVFAFPYQTLLPVFADNVFHIGVSGYGFLLGAAGLGAVVGMGALGLLGNYKKQGTVVLVSITAFGVLLLAFAASGWLPLSLVLMVGVGTAGFVYRTVTVTLMYGLTPPEMYGRVMSILMLDFALMSFGSTLAGALANSYGAPTALAIMASVVVVLAVGMGLASPQLRQLRSEARRKPAGG